MKIYIACPISKYVRIGFPKDFMELMDEIYNLCIRYTSNVYFPLMHEAFGKDKKAGSGEVCTPKDYEEVSKADIILAIPEISMGVSVEIGWASCQNKDILIFIDKAYHQSELIRYIDTITPTKKINIDTSKGYQIEKEHILFEINYYLHEMKDKEWKN